MTTIDVCIPTWNSDDVLEIALDKLRQAEVSSELEIETLRVADNESTDHTETVAKNATQNYDWGLDFQSIPCTLPEARELLIDRVETEWFLFLDDDVRLSESYLEKSESCIAPGIGAIQGRKESKTADSKSDGGILSDIPDSPTDWVRKRAFRGGTHATLIRTEATRTVDYPSDLTVWEDEYLRREIESNGYLWVFNHQALFSHNNQERHLPGWKEGYLQGKYGLRPFWHVLLNVPYALLTGKSPVGFLMMALGHLRGQIENHHLSG